MSAENTLWMGDIEPWMTESIIMNSFQYFNLYPTNVKFIKDKNKGINRTYCFVTFKTIQDATNALINLNGKISPSMNIIFKLNWADYQSASTKTIYVGNLNIKVDDNDLYKLFSQKYSSVHHATVITENGISKGYGFVIFKNEDDYLRCLKEMNGFHFYGNNLKVREHRRKDNEHNNNHDLKDNKNKNRKKNKNNNASKNNNPYLNNIKNNENNINFIYQNNVNNSINNNSKQIINYNNSSNLTMNNNYINNNNLNNNKITSNSDNHKNNIINFNTIQNINIINNNDNGINNNKYLLNNDNNSNNINNNYNQSQSLELLLNKINAAIPYINKNTNNNNNTNTLIYEKNKNNSKYLFNNNNNYLSNKKEKTLFQFDNKSVSNNLEPKLNSNKNNYINNAAKKLDSKNEKKNESNNMSHQSKKMNNNSHKDNANDKNKTKNKNAKKNKYKLEILDNIDETTLCKKIHESILRTFEYQKKLLQNNGVKFKSK